MRTVSATQLHAVQIVEYWKNPRDGELYALARLQIDSVQLFEAMQTELRVRAERMFQKLEEKKR